MLVSNLWSVILSVSESQRVTKPMATPATGAAIGKVLLPAGTHSCIRGGVLLLRRGEKRERRLWGDSLLFI